MFPKKARLPHSAFTTQKGSRSAFRYGTITFFQDTDPRVAIVVSKKVLRGAVDRNKLRRRIAHALRTASVRLSKSVVVYPRKEALHAPFVDLRAALEEVLRSR